MSDKILKLIIAVAFILLLMGGGRLAGEVMIKPDFSEMEKIEMKLSCIEAINGWVDGYWMFVDLGMIPPGKTIDVWMFSFCRDVGIDVFEHERFEYTLAIRPKDLCPIREKLGLPLINFCAYYGQD